MSGQTAGRRELRRPLQAPRRPSHSPRTIRKAVACGDLARVRMERLPPIAAFRVVDWQEITETDSAVMLSPIRYTRAPWIRPSGDDGGAPASKIISVSLMHFLPRSTFSPASAGFFLRDRFPDALPILDIALRVRCSACGSKQIAPYLDMTDFQPNGPDVR